MASVGCLSRSDPRHLTRILFTNPWYITYAAANMRSSFIHVRQPAPMEKISIELSDDEIAQLDRLRLAADKKESSREEFVLDSLRERIDTLLSNPERLDVRKLAA